MSENHEFIPLDNAAPFRTRQCAVCAMSERSALHAPAGCQHQSTKPFRYTSIDEVRLCSDCDHIVAVWSSSGEIATLPEPGVRVTTLSNLTSTDKSSVRDADRKPRPVCSGCGRKAGTIVDTRDQGLLCYGCIADFRVFGVSVEVTTPRPAVRA